MFLLMTANRIAEMRKEVAAFRKQHPEAKVVGGTLSGKSPEQAIRAMKKAK